MKPVAEMTDKELAQHRRSVKTSSRQLYDVVIEQSKRGLLVVEYDCYTLGYGYPKESKKLIRDYDE